MKLAIITLPLHTNYGGLLQAYALQHVLESMGHQVVVVNIKQFSFGLNIPLRRIVKRLRSRYLEHEDCYVFYERKMKQLAPVIRQHTDRFIRTYIHTRDMYALTSIRRNDFDGFVVGSDQIWRPVFFPKIGRAYLDFTAGWDVLRVAYAASFGVDDAEYSDSEIRQCREGISRFNGVSVRERSGVDLCKQYFSIEPEWVLDPTMLLERADYERIISETKVSDSAGDFFYYILDETKDTRQFSESLAASKAMTIFRLNAFSGNKIVPLDERIQPPVESWLRAFADAKFVVTDSFHACVFSILFHKPFYVLPNQGRGMSRIESLLKVFGLEHRLLSQFEINDSLEAIDWDKVDGQLELWRKKSQQFLVRSLSDTHFSKARDIT